MATQHETPAVGGVHAAPVLLQLHCNPLKLCGLLPCQCTDTLVANVTTAVLVM